MYDNDPASPLNVEIYCFNFPKQSPGQWPRLARPDSRQTRCSQGSGAASLIASHFAPGKTEICSLLEFAGFNIKIYLGPLKNFKIIRS